MAARQVGCSLGGPTSPPSFISFSPSSYLSHSIPLLSLSTACFMCRHHPPPLHPPLPFHPHHHPMMLQFAAQARCLVWLCRQLQKEKNNSDHVFIYIKKCFCIKRSSLSFFEVFCQIRNWRCVATLNAKSEPPPKKCMPNFAIKGNSIAIMSFSSLFISLVQWTVFTTFKVVCSNMKNASRARLEQANHRRSFFSPFYFL